jgi:hypothetical protein
MPVSGTDLMKPVWQSHLRASRVDVAATCWKSCVAANRLQCIGTASTQHSHGTVAQMQRNEESTS